MNTAVFVFLGELNDFLARDLRGRDVPLSFEEHQSVKHLVESLGVPHVEVGAVSRDGTLVGLDARPRNGDRLEVRPAPPGFPADPRFLLDNHVGRLAASLRMLGFDCLYENDYSDEQMAAILESDARILLTRDRRLLMRKVVRYGYCLRSVEPPEQLREVVRRFDLGLAARPFSRCLRCNGLLEPVEKAAILDRLELKTKRYYDEFAQCHECAQLYWRGSHWERMKKVVEACYTHFGVQELAPASANASRCTPEETRMPRKSPIHERPAELLQNLIRFDTTNPPGNERPCIEYLSRLLKEAGIKTRLVARTRSRPNLIARLKGEGAAPPLLLYGHVDVVSTLGQKWTHPPFEGKIVDGYVWGRGALDMKGGVAMLLAAFLKAKAEKTRLPGDVIFAAVADEEAGDDYGVRYLVDEHPDLFKDVRYAFGEFGGFNLSIAGKRFYPIMVAEKQTCWMKATFRGPAGHGSMPIRGGAMARLARALRILDERRLPVHVTPAVRMMVEALAKNLGGVQGLFVRALLNPALTDLLLKALGPQAGLFAPLLHNTVSPTMLSASDKVNVIPGEISLGLDGRLVPGGTPEQMISELHALLGEDVAFEVFKAEPGPAAPDMGLFDTLGGVLRELDPAGIPLPFVMSGVTDARFLSKLGIQTYGFTPLQLPEDFNFVSTVHAADERVPVAALDFGVKAIFAAMQRFG